MPGHEVTCAVNTLPEKCKPVPAESSLGAIGDVLPQHQPRFALQISKGMARVMRIIL